jgi:hypothetical protein
MRKTPLNWEKWAKAGRKASVLAQHRTGGEQGLHARTQPAGIECTIWRPHHNMQNLCLRPWDLPLSLLLNPWFYLGRLVAQFFAEFQMSFVMACFYARTDILLKPIQPKIHFCIANCVYQGQIILPKHTGWFWRGLCASFLFFRFSQGSENSNGMTNASNFLRGVIFGRAFSSKRAKNKSCFFDFIRYDHKTINSYFCCVFLISGV